MRDVIIYFVVCVVVAVNAQGKIKAVGLVGQKPQRLTQLRQKQQQRAQQRPPPSNPSFPYRPSNSPAVNPSPSSRSGFSKTFCDTRCKFPKEICVRESRCDGASCYLCAETSSVAASLTKAKGIPPPKYTPPPPPPPRPYDPWDDFFGFGPSSNTGSNMDYGYNNMVFDNPFSMGSMGSIMGLSSPLKSKMRSSNPKQRKAASKPSAPGKRKATSPSSQNDPLNNMFGFSGMPMNNLLFGSMMGMDFGFF